MEITIEKEYFDKLYSLLSTEMYNSYPHQDYKKINIKTENDLLTFKESIKNEIFLNSFVVLSLDPNMCIKKVKEFQYSLFGDSIKDSGKEKLEVAKIAPEENGKYFANSSHAQPLHTDEGHTNSYPRIASLYCAKPSTRGGVSIVVKFENIYNSLKKSFGNNISLLFNKSAITLTNVYGIESKPILIHLPENRIGITYSGIIQGLTCEKVVFEMFDFITNFVHKPENQIRFELKERDLLILDNCRALHARTKFPENDNRVLYRTWFSRLFDMENKNLEKVLHETLI